MKFFKIYYDMRKAVMTISLVSFVLLSTGSIIQLFTKQTQLSWLLIIAGFLAVLAAVLIAIIYWYQQERAREQQFRQWGITAQTNIDLIQCKAEETRPYKREFWLKIASFISICFIMVSVDVMRLAQPQLETTYPLIVWPCIPAFIFIFTFLSRDLAKQSRKAV